MQLEDQLEKLMEKQQERMSRGIEPSFVRGMLSIYSGRISGTEDLADYLKINPSLLDSCILLGNLKQSKTKEKSIESLKSQSSFRSFFKHIKANID